MVHTHTLSLSLSLSLPPVASTRLSVTPRASRSQFYLTLADISGTPDLPTRVEGADVLVEWRSVGLPAADRRLGADAPADREADQPGEHEVEQHQVRGLTMVGGKGVGPVVAEERLHALAAQHDAQHLGQVGVVVDHKNARHHRHMVALVGMGLPTTVHMGRSGHVRTDATVWSSRPARVGTTVGMVPRAAPRMAGAATSPAGSRGAWGTTAATATTTVVATATATTADATVPTTEHLRATRCGLLTMRSYYNAH